MLAYCLFSGFDLLFLIGVTASLMQEFVVDNVTLGYLIYELNRQSQSGMPQAELTSYKLYPQTPRTTQLTSQKHLKDAGVPSHSPALYGVNSSRYPQYTRTADHISPTYALSPPGYPRNAWDPSMPQ